MSTNGFKSAKGADNVTEGSMTNNKNILYTLHLSNTECVSVRPANSARMKKYACGFASLRFLFGCLKSEEYMAFIFQAPNVSTCALRNCCTLFAFIYSNLFQEFLFN